MARLMGKDNLQDLTGKLTAGFNAVTLKTLEQQYAASAPNATKVLTDFFLAASQLQKREHEFNQRAKPAANGPDLKRNLRSREQLEALRGFESAKQTLLNLNPGLGEKIVGVVERNLASSTKPVAKRSFGAVAV